MVRERTRAEVRNGSRVRQTRRGLGGSARHQEDGMVPSKRATDSRPTQNQSAPTRATHLPGELAKSAEGAVRANGAQGPRQLARHPNSSPGQRPTGQGPRAQTGRAPRSGALVDAASSQGQGNGGRVVQATSSKP